MDYGPVLPKESVILTPDPPVTVLDAISFSFFAALHCALCKGSLRPPAWDPFHGVLDDGLSRMMTSPSERSAIHRSVNAILQELAPYGYCVVLSQGLDRKHISAIFEAVTDRGR